ncbi:MAG: ATP-binding protein [Planctomycetota bacterium]
MAGYALSIAAFIGLVVGLAVGVGVATLRSRVKVEQQLEQVRDAERRARAAERLAEIGSMTGGLAHEIKNPLSTIGLNAQLLAEGIAELDADDAERARLTRRVEALTRETERLRGILTDFLDFAGEKRLSPSPTDLNRLVEELADFFHPQADRESTRLRTHTLDAPVVVSVDGPLVKQALLNLMLNAVQAMSDAGSTQRELILRVDVDDEGTARRAAHLRVADTGPGMDAATRESVFQPYFTTKSGGSGLGLPTTRRIVEEHGGRIELHAEPGTGTEFTLSFPMEPAEVGADDAAVNPAR